MSSAVVLRPLVTEQQIAYTCIVFVSIVFEHAHTERYTNLIRAHFTGFL